MNTLPPLPYDYDALEPHIDERTMRIHHTKHHQGYVDNLNRALEPYPDLQAMPVQELLWNLNHVPEEIRTAVRNNGGGHVNHSMFWEIMAPGAGGEPTGALHEAICETYVDFDTLRGKLNSAAMTRFGSGWAWLTIDAEGRLRVESTANQDSPLLQHRTALLGVDVWEHAYYLKYQNRRADYLTAWWNVVNWPSVAERYAYARG
jgi:Fe-Mn family superoxide dismutase